MLAFCDCRPLSSLVSRTPKKPPHELPLVAIHRFCTSFFGTTWGSKWTDQQTNDAKYKYLLGSHMDISHSKKNCKQRILGYLITRTFNLCYICICPQSPEVKVWAHKALDLCYITLMSYMRGKLEYEKIRCVNVIEQIPRPLVRASLCLCVTMCDLICPWSDIMEQHYQSKVHRQSDAHKSSAWDFRNLGRWQCHYFEEFWSFPPLLVTFSFIKMVPIQSSLQPINVMKWHNLENMPSLRQYGKKKIGSMVAYD